MSRYKTQSEEREAVEDRIKAIGYILEDILKELRGIGHKQPRRRRPYQKNRENYRKSRRNKQKE